ncbi:MAG: branched-chain amino acid transaminase [Candidatus ainarchaeum sp.]|nr:branched-chain amino acid transaminase [Candidatus ainarchaeum sp.]
MRTARKVWMDNKFVDWKKANVHIMTHALHYGTAIFEGMRCYNTEDGPAVFRMKDHYKRLANGCKAYQFGLDYSVDKMCDVTKKLIRMNKLKECYIRPIAFVGYGDIGINVMGRKFSLAIIAIPWGAYFGKKAQTGISCGISSWKRISSTILSPHVKASANYLNSVLAKVEAVEEGYDEAVMLTEEGHVSEGTGENLFIVQNGELVTPPLYDGVLAGITRETIMTLAKEMDIKVRERSILRDELYTADEMFLCGTAAEITPVLSVDSRKISDKPGEITKQLRQGFFDVVSGKDERFVKWLDFV